MLGSVDDVVTHGLSLSMDSGFASLSITHEPSAPSSSLVADSGQIRC
jgi:hypothetical protein